jgi:hypothetical protein
MTWVAYQVAPELLDSNNPPGFESAKRRLPFAVEATETQLPPWVVGFDAHVLPPSDDAYNKPPDTEATSVLPSDDEAIAEIAPVEPSSPKVPAILA